MWVVPILLIGILLLIYTKYKIRYEDINKLPGPPIKLLTGNATEFGSTIVDLFEASQRIIKKYGRITKVWFGPFRLSLFVTDPEMAAFFLSPNRYLKKSRGYQNVKGWLGEGLINSEGYIWRKHRKIITPAFHLKILDPFSEIFHRHLQILIETFKREEGRSIDICHPITLYAMDVLCETSMGITSNCQSSGESKYMKSSKGFLEIHVKRFFSFLKLYDFFFKYTHDYTVLMEHIHTMHKITEHMIELRKKQRGVSQFDSLTDDVGIPSKKVFMDLLLDHPGLSNQEVRWEVDTFVFAGHDTVAATMSIALYELAKHKQVQIGLLEEIYDIVSTDRTIEIQMSHLQEMSYMDRVVKEILRLYPAVPFIERELTENVIYKGMRIPKDTTLSFHIYAQHRDPELFHDPETFDPDRFLPENTMKRHPFAYIPFSAGPRNCIGQKYALMNIKAMVANIIRNFELQPADFPHTPIIGNNVVLKFVNGLPIRLIYRE